MPSYGRNVSGIKNKSKRQQIYAKVKKDKKKAKKERREKRKREEEELGDKAPPRQVPRTLDNTREADETVVGPEDAEVLEDEETDEFSDYFLRGKTPKIMVTTRPKPSTKLYDFVRELMTMIPNIAYYARRTFHIKDICKLAAGKGFTHLIVLSEKNKVCNGAIVSHLPHGPTAFFKVTRFVSGADIAGHGAPTSHIPEILLNNFNTRLGHRVGRFLGSLFPHKPNFKGRQVVTFHNQRDFIFVRHHRYIFDKENDKGMPQRARLQELGPRFTLKMRWLQVGTFDTKNGEYEWIHKRKKMDTTRRKFHL
eukprot:g2603.t1